ncbi:MAG: glycosyl hydrolase family 18 protein [Caldilineaceae bacterium]
MTTAAHPLIPLRKWGMFTGFTLFWLLLVMALATQPASAHGSMENPLSRIYNCYKELTTGTLSPACQAAMAASGVQQFYDWNGVRHPSASGQHRTVIPDGKLCSAGLDSHKGLDLARTDWVAQNITPDANGNFEFVYYATAPHASQDFQFYVTKDNYDPTQPLTWSALEDTPFCTSGAVPLVDGHYHITCHLPTGKSGKHVIYNIWQRSDSGEAFYSCIDVNFAGAASGNNTPTATVTPTSDPSGCNAPAWNTATSYQADQLVAHNGNQWRAKWWTQNEEPGTTGEWGVWEDRGACGAPPPPTTTPVPPTPTPLLPTVTAPATAGTSTPTSCTASAWNVSAIYQADQVVSYNGRQWRAKWWTQGEQPGTTGQWGVWEDRGPCNGSNTPVATATVILATATSLPPTVTPIAPTATALVPTATSAAPTATSNPTGCSAPAWNVSAVYQAAQLVSYNGHQWRAKWWTQGEQPGTTGQWGVWEDRGPCNASTPAPTVTPIVTPGATATATPTGQTATNNRTLIAYFAQWGIYGRNYHVKNILSSGSAAKLNVINYAFGNVVNGQCIMTTQSGVMDAYADYQRSYGAADSVSGVADQWNQPLRGNFNQLKQLKARYPQLKVLISLGGWTWSDGFHDAAMTAASRQRLVSSCIDIYIRGNLPMVDNAGGTGAAAGLFDGIDIDWEYPGMPGEGNPYGPEDTHNFTLLLQEFRTQLNAINPNLMLTIATGGASNAYGMLELNQIHPLLNYLNIMSYDYHGAWEQKTGFLAPLYPSNNAPYGSPVNSYAVDTAVRGFIQAGVPANKIVMGIPLYGRGWQGVANVNNGLWQNGTGGAPGVYEAGVNDYKVIQPLLYPVYRDNNAVAMWKYNGNIFWSYEDEVTIAAKTQYIRQYNLGGAMAWSLDGDDSSGTLVNAIYNGLQPVGAATDISSPESGQANKLFLPLVSK